MLRTAGGRPGLRRLLVSYVLAASLRCQASSVAGVTAKTPVQRPDCHWLRHPAWRGLQVLPVARHEHAVSPILNTAETAIFCPVATAS
jgi:hypothetical protein